MNKGYILDNKTEEEHNKYLFEIEKGKFIHVKELLLSFEDLQKQVEDLVKQLQQKENIRKEAREYIEKTQYMPEAYKKTLLEILDKEK